MRYAAPLLLIIFVDMALTWNLPAHARAQSDLPYSLADAFSTALRFVRIDRGCKVVDKDSEAAFVAFECQEDGKVHRGSLEIFKVQSGVRAQVTLGDDTHGMELRWLELLERKLRDERGVPVPPPPPAPKDESGTKDAPKDAGP